MRAWVGYRRFSIWTISMCIHDKFNGQNIRRVLGAWKKAWLKTCLGSVHKVFLFIFKEELMWKNIQSQVTIADQLIKHGHINSRASLFFRGMKLPPHWPIESCTALSIFSSCAVKTNNLLKQNNDNTTNSLFWVDL